MILLLNGCTDFVAVYSEMGQTARIFPEYEGTYIPYNIAPLNFQIKESGDKFKVRFSVAGKDSFELSTSKKVNIPLRKWKKLLDTCRGEKLSIKIFTYNKGGWTKYNDVSFTIAPEPIDPYIAYRLIEPGYETYNEMGLYQRCVESFDEFPILINSLTDNNCMNCHSFCKNNPETMLFHMREKNSGTIVVTHGEIKKINAKAPGMTMGSAYPNWHPAGRYIAFSSNAVRQSFLTAHTNKIEVFDLMSDIVLYDTQTNKMYLPDILNSKNSYETYPAWSPDGNYLYFCSAPALPMPEQYQSIRYDLLRIAFDPATGSFANKVDTLVHSRDTRKSMALPRVSSDGRYVLFCMFDYGTFPIHHKETDLFCFDLQSGKIDSMTEMNSKSQSDSYHSWSSNGRWVVFGSRRIDGIYTRLFISYFDADGKAHKPILLPQKDPEYYDYLLKSYNLPEFITGKIKISPYTFSDVAKNGNTITVSSGGK
jgi:hypothetical protein